MHALSIHSHVGSRHAFRALPELAAQMERQQRIEAARQYLASGLSHNNDALLDFIRYFGTGQKEKMPDDSGTRGNALNCAKSYGALSMPVLLSPADLTAMTCRLSAPRRR